MVPVVYIVPLVSVVYLMFLAPFVFMVSVVSLYAYLRSPCPLYQPLLRPWYPTCLW